MKNILIPTDFSKNATDAAKYTLNLFENEKCKFYHLHSVDIEVSRLNNLTHKFTQSIREEALIKLNKLKSYFTITDTKFKNRQKTILSFDSLVDSVKLNTKKHKIDLVVMGTKGMTGLRKMFFGSNAVNVLNQTEDCATLIVPDEMEFKTINKIGFPTDLKSISPKVIEDVKFLAKLHNATILIMHILDDDTLTDIQQENLDKLKKEFKGIDYYFHVMPLYDKVAEEILDFIEDAEIDFLAITKNEHSFIEKIFREPVIQKLGHKITIPLMVVPQAN
ncbi:universal stress protein [Tenacibaculum sp. 190524A05c]|uniref:Nucleotide-binding universal stress UspA family protein n=1 Tax=Tenacibaculum platacis TaxID=3137852 RepID=A0ABP1ES46_9FLAO